MTDLNTPITITNELNVPDTNDAITSFNVDDVNNEACRVVSTGDLSHPAPSTSSKAKSADRSRRIPPRLRAETKSQSLLNFTSKAPLVRTVSDETPTITICAASASQYQRCHPPRVSSATFPIEYIECNHLEVSRKISASTNEFKLSANRKRIDSTESNRDDDDVENEDRVAPQLRIRSSIISLFGRMGRFRRPSSFSTNSNSNNDIGGGGGVGGAFTANGTNDNSPSLRALPQIAAARILRAFSYVGKTLTHSLTARPLRSSDLCLYFPFNYTISINELLL